MYWQCSRKYEQCLGNKLGYQRQISAVTAVKNSIKQDLSRKCQLERASDDSGSHCSLEKASYFVFVFVYTEDLKRNELRSGMREREINKLNCHFHLSINTTDPT